MSCERLQENNGEGRQQISDGMEYIVLGLWQVVQIDCVHVRWVKILRTELDNSIRRKIIRMPRMQERDKLPHLPRARLPEANLLA